MDVLPAWAVIVLVLLVVGSIAGFVFYDSWRSRKRSRGDNGAP
jgi:hypothetical protein